MAMQVPARPRGIVRFAAKIVSLEQVLDAGNQGIIDCSITLVTRITAGPHFSPGSREQAQDSCL
jgi:hypothetical protein